MRVMIETSAPLSETDYKILNLLLERHESVAAPAEPEAKPEPKKAPAKKAEPEPEEAKSEETETTVPSPVSDENMDKVVSTAKALLQDGKKAEVKKALEAAGVARVGAIETASQATAFLAAVGA